MSRKWIVLLIALLLLALSFGASAEKMVVRNDVLSAYTDGNGKLYITGNADPVNTKTVTELVDIDAYRILFLSKNELGTKELVSYSLVDKKEKVLASNVLQATLSDENTIYYIDGADNSQLMKIDLETGETKKVYASANEPLKSVYTGVLGPVIEQEGVGTLAYNAMFNTFATYADSVPYKQARMNSAEVSINGAELTYREKGGKTQTIAKDVLNFTILDNQVYYLERNNGTVRVKVYDPAANTSRVLLTPNKTLDGTITSSEKKLFLIDTENNIWSVDPKKPEMVSFAKANANLKKKQKATYTIEAMSGQLNLYAQITDANTNPFAMMALTSNAPTNAGDMTLLTTYKLSDEQNAWGVIQPVASFSFTDPEANSSSKKNNNKNTAAPTTKVLPTLLKGSRGEAVSDIQKPLADKGYYDYYIDGIYGWRTETAVQLLQDALGLTVTGKADDALQRRILSGDIPAYDPYSELKSGDRGNAVQRMQERLRELGYLADAADGIFGKRTKAAVTLFQEENGLTADGVATKKTLKALFDEDAEACSSFIDLYRGDSGIRVSELNRRLRNLGYLEGKASDVFTSRTREAVQRFQAEAGMRITGDATVTVLKRLFAKNAPEYTGLIELRRGDESWRVSRLQRRLKELGYFHGNCTGYFGSQTQQAVRLFQQAVGLKVNGVATVRTQMLLYSPSAPVYDPIHVGKLSIYIDEYDYYKNGVYYVDENCDNGGVVTVSWFAAGDVGSYKVEIVDEKGHKFYNDTSKFESVSVEMSRLTLDMVYHVTVTAIPTNGDMKKSKTDTLSFCRTTIGEEPEIGEIDNVALSVTPVKETVKDMPYVGPGDVSFDWSAEGDVASYKFALTDNKGKSVFSAQLTNEYLTVQASKMTEGVTYTATVTAIPVNGTEKDGKSATLQFQLAKAEVIETLPAPEINLPDVDKDDAGIYAVGDADEFTVQWNAVEGAVQYALNIADAAGKSVYQDTTTDTSLTVSTASLNYGLASTLSVTAIPEGGTEANGTPANILIYRGVLVQTVFLPAPEIHMLNAVAQDNGVQEVSGGMMELTWEPVAEATAYNVVLRDENGELLSQETTEETNISIDNAGLTANAVYTISVNGLADESEDVVQAEAGMVAFSIEEGTDVVPEEPQTEPEMTNVSLSVSEYAAYEDGVYGFAGEALHLDWSCDGATKFNVTLSDSEGNVYSDQLVEAAAYDQDLMILQDSMLWTLTIAPVDGADTKRDELAASITFRKATDTPESEVTDEAGEAPQEDEIPVEEGAEAETQITIATIDIQPMLGEQDGVIILSEGDLTFHWMASDETVSQYAYTFTDSNGNVLVQSTMNGTDGTLPSSVFEKGAVYELIVAACDADGAEIGIPASKSFMVAADAMADETSEGEPTEEPASGENEETEESEYGESEGSENAEPEQAEEIALPVMTGIGINGEAEYIDDCYVVGGDTIEIYWTNDGEADEFVLTLEGQSMNTTDHSITFDVSYMEPDYLYTMDVAPVANPDSSIGISFLCKAQEESEPEETYEEAEEEYIEHTEVEEEPEETYEEPEYVEEEPEDTILGTVEMDYVSCDSASFTDGDVSILEDVNATFSWSSSGEAASFTLRVCDDYGSTILEGEVQQTEITTDLSGLDEGSIYTFEVIANPAENWEAGDNVASVRFSLAAEEPEEVYEEPEEEYVEPEEEYYAPEEVYEEPEEVYEEPEEEYYEEPEEEAFEESVSVGESLYTVLDIQNKLVQLQYLEAYSYTEDVLDETTINAVVRFMQDQGYNAAPEDYYYGLDDSVMETIMNYYP